MTMTERDQTCESRIAEHMNGRESAFAELFAAASGERVECSACDGTGDGPTFSWTQASAEWQSEHGEPDSPRTESADAFLADGDGYILCPVCNGATDVPATVDGETITEDDAQERISEMPLAVSVRRSLRVDLSTGGPGDWIEADLDDDGDVEAVTYHFNDWFDHAERRVDEGSALWTAAENYAEYVRG